MLLRSLHRAAQAAESSTPLFFSLVTCSSGPTALALTVQQQQMYLQQTQQQQHLHSWQVSCVDQMQQQTQYLASQQTAVVQQCRQQLLLPVRHFTSSSSCCAETPATDAFAEQETKQQQKRKQQEEDLQSVLDGMPGELLRQPIFTNKLSSKIKSRKPAIKTPARHQWRHTAEDYDPMEPFAAQSLPPYAPLLAHTKDYNQIYKETQPKFNRGSYRRLWRKNMAIADQRWKMAWEKKLAAARKEEEVVQKLRDRIIRERSWQVWQLQQQEAGGGQVQQ